MKIDPLSTQKTTWLVLHCKSVVNKFLPESLTVGQESRMQDTFSCCCFIFYATKFCFGGKKLKVCAQACKCAHVCCECVSCECVCVVSVCVLWVCVCCECVCVLWVCVCVVSVCVVSVCCECRCSESVWVCCAIEEREIKRKSHIKRLQNFSTNM